MLIKGNDGQISPVDTMHNVSNILYFLSTAIIENRAFTNGLAESPLEGLYSLLDEAADALHAACHEQMLRDEQNRSRLVAESKK